MSLNIEIKTVLGSSIQGIENLSSKNLRFYTSYATRQTGRRVVEDLRSVMRSRLDRPTPYTLNSLKVSQNKKNQDFDSVVEWKTSNSSSTNTGGKYLKPQVFGGQRALKGFEVLLRSRGILPTGFYAVPAKDAPRDAYGNLSRGILVAMLSYLGALRDQLQNRNVRSKRKTKFDFIVVTDKGTGQNGIYQTRNTAWGTGLKPIIFFTDRVTYRKRFPFYQVAERISKKFLPLFFREAYLKFPPKQRAPES